MKKMFLIFGILALTSLCASAATTTYNFTFDGYCDGMTLNLYKPAGLPKVIFGGTHNNWDCAGNFGYVGGFKHAINAGYQPGSIGAVLDVSDPIGPYFIGPVSVQFLVNTVYHTWIIYEGADGVGNYYLNSGTYTNVTGPKMKGTGAKASALR